MAYFCIRFLQFHPPEAVKQTDMLIVHVDNGESIDKALKRYKNKHRSTRLMDQMKNRQYFTKPSVERRNKVLNASYRDQVRQEIEG